MRAALISQGSTSSQWTLKAMRNYFDQADDVYLKEIEIQTSKNGLQVRYKGKELPEYDCIFAKGSFRYPLHLRSISDYYYDKCYMPIRPETFSIGHDKWLTHLVLQRRNIPMPTTYLSPDVKTAKLILKKINYPVILKYPSGTQGKGVMFTDSYASASSMLDALSMLNQPVIIQDYVETGGSDIRTIVCGQEVIASMKRVAVKGEKRANIHAGGTGEAYTPTAKVRKVAVQTAEAIGADMCAVDILESVKGPTVIEVNLSPGLQGITKATGTDVADKIGKFLYRKTKEFVKKKKASVHTSDILKEVGVDSSQEGKIKEIITNINMRGQRILLPENVTKLTNFRENGEYVIKYENGELIIKKFNSK
ncbi:MAG: Tetrahydromethanopterin:alpha-L-glutamate ligase [Candidatus Woesearchaeota archaeon]|nr:Tetrahydromethanopterin:alpha-L-glutamate ligase [Candidatus Woesearchaeota archaeon]